MRDPAEVVVKMSDVLQPFLAASLDLLVAIEAADQDLPWPIVEAALELKRIAKEAAGEL